MLGWQRKRNSPPEARPSVPGGSAKTAIPRGVIVRKSSVDLARPTFGRWVSQAWLTLRLALSDGGSKRTWNGRGTSDRWYPLVLDVVTYCNTMMIDGHIRRQEIYQPAVQAYYADYYLAQVMNGGHSQFVGNAAGKLPMVIEESRKGLAAMGATEHLALLEKAADWVASNPKEAMLQTGFEGGRAEALNALDSAFYAAEEAKRMAELSARWILSWPELQVVEDADLRAAIAAAAGVHGRPGGGFGANPRIRIAEIVQRQATDVTQVGIGLACGAVNRIPHSVGASPYTEIDGVHALFVGTGGRTFCFCAVAEERIALYAGALSPGSIAPLPAPTGDRFRDARDRSNGGMPEPGEKLAEISLETAEATVALAERYHLGSAASLLLAKATVGHAEAFLSAAGIETPLETTVWVLVVGSQILEVTQSPSKTVLSDYKTKAVIATVEADEIARFAEQARS